MDLFLEKLSDSIYQESTEFLYQLQYSGIKLGLANIKRFLQDLGNPQHKLKTIHLAGTNGKGSTLAMLESILIEAGYNVGAYTSPHLISFQERIRVNRRLISVDYIHHFVKEYKERISELKLTFFEATTGLAFKYFSEHNPDIVLVETGLGGRLDSTNVINSPVVLITHIDYDHEAYLGHNLPKITMEKAGIIHTGCDVFSSNTQKEVTAVIEKKCEYEKSGYFPVKGISRVELSSVNPEGMMFHYFSEKIDIPSLKIPLIGTHQLENAQLAITSVLYNKVYLVEKEAIIRGLLNTFWPGRLQLVQKKPNVFIDVGHNPDGFRNALDSVKNLTKGSLHIICGIVNDKNTKEIAELIEYFGDFIYLVEFKANRLLPSANFITSFKGGKTVKIEVAEAYLQLNMVLKRAAKEDTILIIGSHYLIGEFYYSWLKNKKEFDFYYKTS